jgi:hypothetical protein
MNQEELRLECLRLVHDGNKAPEQVVREACVLMAFILGEWSAIPRELPLNSAPS